MEWNEGVERGFKRATGKQDGPFGSKICEEENENEAN